MSSGWRTPGQHSPGTQGPVNSFHDGLALSHRQTQFSAFRREMAKFSGMSCAFLPYFPLHSARGLRDSEVAAQSSPPAGLLSEPERFIFPLGFSELAVSWLLQERERNQVRKFN